MLGQGEWHLGTVGWLAALTLLLVTHPLAARATRLEATVAGVAALGLLCWVDPALTAIVAAPLLAGAVANRRAAAARTAGMSAVGAVLTEVSADTAQLISAGHGERVGREHVVTVDRFHDVFSAQTRRVSTAVALVEIALSPVTILAVILAAGTVLVSSGADLLAFLLLGPAVAGCVATLTRQPSTDAPPQVATGAQASIRTTMARLGSVITPGNAARKAVIAATLTALLHGISLTLAITVVWSLLDQSRSPQLPLFSLLAVAIAHILALRWSHSSAQIAGVTVLRQLSHRIVGKILMAPAGSLTEYEDQLPRLVTRDSVITSGLPVHALRPFASAVLTPAAAILAMIIIEWRQAIPALLLLPIVTLAVFLLLKQPRRDLQLALAATNRVLAFLKSTGR